MGKTNARKGILWLNAGEVMAAQGGGWSTGQADRQRHGWKDEWSVPGTVLQGLCGRDPSVGLSDGHFIMSAMHEVLKNDSLSKWGWHKGGTGERGVAPNASAFDFYARRPWGPAGRVGTRVETNPLSAQSAAGFQIVSNATDKSEWRTAPPPAAPPVRR